MSDDDEMITCLECGEEVPLSMLDEHSVIMHGQFKIREMSKADQRLQAKRAKSGSGPKIAAGVVITIFILLLANFIFLQPVENDSSGGESFQDTEDQPDIISLPDDDDDIDPGNNGQDPDNNDNTTDPNGNGDDNHTDDPEILAIQVPTSEVTTNAKWYPYDYDGVEIRFFCVIIKISDLEDKKFMFE